MTYCAFSIQFAWLAVSSLGLLSVYFATTTTNSAADGAHCTPHTPHNQCDSNKNRVACCLLNRLLSIQRLRLPPNENKQNQFSLLQMFTVYYIFSFFCLD